jgi:hypothetical protein
MRVWRPEAPGMVWMEEVGTDSTHPSKVRWIMPSNPVHVGAQEGWGLVDLTGLNLVLYN